LKDNEQHHETKYENYDQLVRGFFEYLKDMSKDQKHWLALGSNQKVYKKANFIPKARKAARVISEAISKKENQTVYGLWRSVFGLHFPYPRPILESSTNFTDKEEFIEDLYPVDIGYQLNIDCEVSQAGFRTELLSLLTVVKTKKKLKFLIKYTDCPKQYLIKWKVKNKGEIAKKRTMLRGQILSDDGAGERIENSNFGGEHYVECYLIKDNICVARDRIDVPISIDFSDSDKVKIT
jgi:hypothetical protein